MVVTFMVPRLLAVRNVKKSWFFNYVEKSICDKYGEWDTAKTTMKDVQVNAYAPGDIPLG